MRSLRQLWARFGAAGSLVVGSPEGRGPPPAEDLPTFVRCESNPWRPAVC